MAYSSILQNEINFCTSNPCIHGGVCNPVFNNYQCNCPSGWAGKNCEMFVEQCSVNGFGRNCLQNAPAQCHDLFNDYYCE